MGTIDLIVIVCAGLAIYGILRWHQVEQNDYAKAAAAVADLQADIDALKRYAETEIKNHGIDLTSYDKRLKEMEAEVDQAQEHIAKLRASYMKLRNRVLTKQPVVKVTGAIPVEIMGPTKPHQIQLKKLQKQIKTLSK